MGEVVGAGLVSHVPTIMLPEEVRLEINDGKEISLVTGLRRIRSEVLDRLRPDTVVVMEEVSIEWKGAHDIWPQPDGLGLLRHCLGRAHHLDPQTADVEVRVPNGRLLAGWVEGDAGMRVGVGAHDPVEHVGGLA